MMKQCQNSKFVELKSLHAQNLSYQINGQQKIMTQTLT